MNFFQAFMLGVLQGATEFLPVSSSGHLVLFPWFLGWSPPSLAFDTVVHWGTMVAVIAYFWRDWVALVRAAWQSIRESIQQRSWATTDPQARLAWWIVVGTIPAALIGYLWEDFFEALFSRPVAAASLLLVTALLLALSEYLGNPHRAHKRDLTTLSGWEALLIGCAQALAIFPGISRSGATIAAGLLRGLERTAAARFSFLLATPIILGAGVLSVGDLVGSGEIAAQATILIVGFLAAAISGFACISFLMRYLQTRRLYPFAIYCTLLAIFGLLRAWLMS